MQKVDQKVIVIGAGFSGMAVAAKLAKKGFDVIVLEKNSLPGGRASIYQKDGFKFDIGPSWFMMPDIFERYFQDLEEDIKNYIDIVRLDPSYRVYFNKDNIVDLYPDFQKVIELFESKEKGSGEKLIKYLKDAKYKYDTGMKYYVYRVYDSIFDFFNWRLIIKGLKLDLFSSLDKHVRRYFENEDLIKILEFMVIFIGGSPNNVPALYSLLAYADLNLGVWYPKNGIYGASLGLEKVCKKFGVTFHYDTEVTKILYNPKSNIKTLYTNKGVYKTKIIVSSADYPFVETKLLDRKYCTYDDNYWDKRILSPSSLLFYVGVNKKLNELAHHSLFFNNNWNYHFDSIYKKAKWPKRPLYYVSATSQSDATVAPKGCETLVILVPIASGLKDTQDIREKYFNEIISDMEYKIGVSFMSNIVVKESFSINDFKSYFNAYKGNAFGLAHTLFQTAIFRPAYKSKNIPDLFYSGQFTTPGVGLPIAIISGQIIADVINIKHGKQSS